MYKKQVSTTIDERLYNEIKEKGYKISELIELGLRYKEEREITKEKIEEIINRIEYITKDWIKEKLNEIKEYIREERERILERNIIRKNDVDKILSSIEEKIDEILQWNLCSSPISSNS